MLDGAPVAAVNVTLCTTPLVLFHVTVPVRVMETLVGLNVAAFNVTDADGDGDGAGGGGGGGVIPPPSPPPPPQASSAPKIRAVTHRERISGIAGSSVVMVVEAGYKAALRSVL